MGRTSSLERALLAGALLCAAVFVLCCVGVAGTPLDKAYHGVELCSTVICVLRARGRERLAWGVLSVGLIGYGLGDVYYTIALGDDPPFPSPADALYLSIFPASYAALVLLLRARAPRLSAKLWLDGLICALGAAALGAAVVLSVVASTDGSLAAVITNLAYPLGDCLMLAFVVSVMLVAGRAAGWTWRLLALAFATWAFADTIYLYQASAGTYHETTLLDVCWPAAYVLLALAALRPAERLDAERLRGGLLVLPAGATLLALALLVYDHYSRLNALAVWLATAAVVAAVVRFVLTFRENLRSLQASEVEATTDQ